MPARIASPSFVGLAMTVEVRLISNKQKNHNPKPGTNPRTVAPFVLRSFSEGGLRRCAVEPIKKPPEISEGFYY